MLSERSNVEHMPEDRRTDVAAWLRAQPALSGRSPSLDVDALPDDPVVLFLDWLATAIDGGVDEPHAMTLATVDPDGLPDARTLILKDVDERGWAFASQRSSRKALQLAAQPMAALNFWWQPQMRAVRVRGAVVEASAAESAADLAARSAASRAGIADGEWTLWRVVPRRVEFWHGAVDRDHTRIVFGAADVGWQRSIDGGKGRR